MDAGGSVTLVFYKIPDKWYREPFLNIVAAAFQNSSFTHVELAIGSTPGDGGQMTNVARVFNDNVGKWRHAARHTPHAARRNLTQQLPLFPFVRRGTREQDRPKPTGEPFSPRPRAAVCL